MNRRDFLHPRNIAFQAGQIAGALQGAAAVAEERACAEPVPLLRGTYRAMATRFEVLLPFGTPNSQAIFQDAFEHIDDLEQQLTVYSDDSEMSRINRLAASAAVPAEPNLYRLLKLAKWVSDETDGAFDITAGRLIKAWGFFRGPPRVPSNEEINAARRTVGMDNVDLDDPSRTVRFRRNGTELNLGSIGKGYALDRVANRLREIHGCTAALLNGGHSSVYALGAPSGQIDGWRVSIRHPSRPAEPLGTLCLRDQALGTSAATFRHLEYEGRRLGHILDPRTGWPAEGIASASVIAPTGALADALATAFFILGVDAPRRYCEMHPDVAAVILPEGETAKPIAIGVCLEEP